MLQKFPSPREQAVLNGLAPIRPKDATVPDTRETSGNVRPAGNLDLEAEKDADSANELAA
jgi:hypothetical protein